ncbi:MAG: pyridoxamine 5'-phosphate oxidase family protein [Alphaproteobacteria bacterium]|nr:pyridoxamine 5'-phosphate oxidase family protein [Alphaproteobacteria bacterium]
MTKDQKQSFIDIIRSCDTVILATNGLSGYPDARNVINIFNRETTGLDLYFFTSSRWRLPDQIAKNKNACLYYFNPTTRMSIRLFGEMTAVDNIKDKKKRWVDGIKKFGVTGFDDPTYILLRFAAKRYKYYVGLVEYEGEV